MKTETEISDEVAGIAYDLANGAHDENPQDVRDLRMKAEGMKWCLGEESTYVPYTPTSTTIRVRGTLKRFVIKMALDAATFAVLGYVLYVGWKHGGTTEASYLECFLIGVWLYVVYCLVKMPIANLARASRLSKIKR